MKHENFVPLVRVLHSAHRLAMPLQERSRSWVFGHTAGRLPRLGSLSTEAACAALRERTPLSGCLREGAEGW